MSDLYERANERAKNGKLRRLAFKSGSVAALKSIDKKKHKKNKKNKLSKEENPSGEIEIVPGDTVVEADIDGETSAGAEAGGGGDIYTIDAAKRMKYDQLFPVEAKKFGYDPKSVSTSVEKALDDRVTKKADRYCK